MLTFNFVVSRKIRTNQRKRNINLNKSRNQQQESESRMLSLMKLSLLCCWMLSKFGSHAFTTPQAARTAPSISLPRSDRSGPFAGFSLHSDADDNSEGGGQIYTGTVKWFDTVKGFGFILPDDNSSDVFVHQTAIQTEGFRSLADGESVEYSLETDEKTGRRKAVGVTGPGGQDVQGAPFQPPMNDGY